MSESDLAAQLQADQHQRWRRGETVGVETYLAQYPALEQAPEIVLDLILNEVILREERGQQPPLNEFLARFPHLASPIRLMFEVHQALESSRLSGNGTGIHAEASEAAGSRSWPSLEAEAEDRDPSRVAVPGYQIQEELGRGGMGVVYRALQIALKRPVALKMILAGTHAGPRERARFRIEAEAVARLQHPHIVQIYEVGESDGRPYLALELVVGQGLDRRLGGNPQPPREAARLAEILARAVDQVHRQGILHRDLKPSNVLLTSEGVPKLSDFGLAKLLDSESGQTPTEALIGTPSYMAPEQAAGQTRAIGPASDVYALGAILYELLTGRPPFRAETPLDTLLLVVSQEPVPPTRLQPRVPRDLETICLKCLEKSPRQRYAGAGLLADDLGRFLAGEPIHARPVTLWQRGWKWAWRRPSAAALLAVSLTAIVTLAGLAFWYEATERRRLGAKRLEAERSILTAEQAFSRRDYQGARYHLSGALAAIGREPALAGPRTQAERLLAEANRWLGQQEARRDALARLARFDELRNEVLFQGTLPVDADTAASLQAARVAARDALAVVGLGDRPASAPAFEPAEKDAVARGSYELLLVLADAEAQRLPRQTLPEHRGRVAEALRILERAARLSPPTRSYYERRARYLALLGDEPGARDQRQQAAALAPAGGDAFLHGVDLVMGSDRRAGRDDLLAAVEDFEQALRIQPDHFWARYYLALCHLSSRPDLARVYLTDCLNQRPDFVWIYLLRGYAEGVLREFAAAEADFARARTLPADAEARYALLVNRGLLRLAEGKLAESAADLEQAIALHPKKFRAHVDLALVLKKGHQTDAALARLDAALKLVLPDLVRTDLLVERARLLLLSGRPRDALEVCDGVLGKESRLKEALGVRAQALLDLGEFAEANRSFTRYLDDGGPPVADIYRGRGQARMKIGDYPGATDDYARALLLRPDAEIHEHRGWAYFFAEAPRLALADFDASLALDPERVEARIGRGLARVALGQTREAVADAEAALRRTPATAEMLHNIACIFARAAGQVGSDQSRPDREELAQRYGTQAVQAIRRSLARVPAADRRTFWRDKVQPDTYLDPIRQRPDFLEIQHQIDEATPGTAS